MEYLYAYLLIINAAAFAFMIADKRKAQKSQWRISERFLILIAAFGGSIGMLFGMYACRHKTKNPNFTLGIPIIALLQVGIGIALSLIKK